jgi:hypothetical protein
MSATALPERAAVDRNACASATQDLSVEEMIRLIAHAPPGPWPGGWASWSNVNEAHRVMARRFAATLTPPRLTYPRERGIVIAGGGLKYFPSVWVGVNLIRHFGCTLPIQLWHLGKGEIDPYLRRLLKPLGVECVDAREVEKEHPCRILCGWELKPFATLHSPFEEVLFLDADCGPCRDVTEVFAWPEYLDKGAVFWPDYACWQLKRDVWEIFDVPEVAARWQGEVAFESGQHVVNKNRCWRELRMALWYAEHSDFVFRVVYGDKECFHLGWRKLGSDYAMPAKAPGWNQHTIVQWGTSAASRCSTTAARTSGSSAAATVATTRSPTKRCASGSWTTSARCGTASSGTTPPRRPPSRRSSTNSPIAASCTGASATTSDRCVWNERRRSERGRPSASAAGT